MTDRYNAFVVILDRDIRDEDAKPILEAIRMIKCVLSVEPHINDVSDHVAMSRARDKFGKIAREAYMKIAFDSED